MIEFSEFLQKVGNNVKERRKKLGRTQKEMSALGIGQRHMQDIESGNGNLTLKTLWKLASIFKVQVNDLLGPSTSNSVCNFQDGFFDKLMPHLPMACIVWQFVDLQRGGFYKLKYCNKRAQELTYAEIKEKVGEPLLDIFPHVESLGFIAFLDSARNLNKSVYLDDFVYGDQKVNFGHFKVTAVPICHGEVVVFFDSINEKVLLNHSKSIPRNIHSQIKTLELSEPASCQS